MEDYGTCVYTAAGEFEAQHIKGFLEAHGIPCTIGGEALRKTHGLTLDGLGAAKIIVPDAFAEEARDLLARAEAGEIETSGVPPTDPRDDGAVILPFRKPEE